MQAHYSHLWIAIPKILLPAPSVDLKKWAVVACDQYTSQPTYREEVAGIVGEAPSTFHIIYPEVYLEEEDKIQRIEKIHHHMVNYLATSLTELWPCLVLLDRKTSHTSSRKWLVLTLDLEAYDYSPDSQTLIRATEWTILDRLPPRIQIRNGAPIESPHIMVLIDDPDRTVIEPLFADVSHYTRLYDTDLMMSGGHITGYQISDEQKISQIVDALTDLAQPQVFQQKYAVGAEKGVLLFAMWDGNHSLATAKAIWEEKKKTLNQDQRSDHPARFALVELVNVHDTWLTFEPIHRVLFDVDVDALFADMKRYFSEQDSDLVISHYSSAEEQQQSLKESSSDHHYIRFVAPWTFGILDIVHPKLNLEVGNLQAFLDQYLQQHSQVKIDYVHGEETTIDLWSQPGNVGFLLPIMDKGDFFKTVIVDGALPRKTFSMWEAEEKRFYLECRKI